ncbi:phospholipase D-like domain-containing protein [Pararhodobacter sp. SW119]|uniref:phospholipase D-like domain-containing protein n=1 Tax=Pararhodobacter sp. SW119 TaxID=2780075 RepID=UPI001ADFC6B7|nr:phospholipase D-like domain-containing protein [Pararhodobacter sp. SW119]
MSPSPRRYRRKLRIAVAAVVAVVLFWFFVVALMPYRHELRRAVPPGTPACDPQFARDMAGLYGSAIISGNRITTLVNGDAIFAAMLEAIGEAERSITFETYIYWTGAIAERFCDALIDRVKAGVRVKVLIDWAGSLPMSDDLIDRMHENGVELRMFRPMRLRTLTRLNNRTHRKILVVDGKLGFIGGVGIADEWCGDARNPGEWRDTHYRVAGPIVAMLQNAFAHNWVEAHGEVLRGDAFYPELAPQGDTALQLVKSNTGSRNEIHLMMMTALAGAERHIRISTPYFVPDNVVMDQLLQARKRGIRVDLMLAARQNDSVLVRRVSRRSWRKLLEAGVHIHEFTPTFLHAKLLIVDECWASFGSANFDERSFRLNDEANLNVYDEAVVAEQIGLFNADLARSRPVTIADLDRIGWLTHAQDIVLSILKPHL